MRILWEILTLCIALGILFAISKGFPQFGQVLRALLFNPISLIAIVGIGIWITMIRKRAKRPPQS